MAKTKMETLVSKWYSIDQCRKNPTSIFIFGDNYNMRSGNGGQAIIRDQDNAIGICTKWNPGTEDKDYFDDKDYEKIIKLIDEDINRVNMYIEEKGYKDIVFPFQGIGTGLSTMQTKAPKVFCYLTVRLLEEWKFNNISALKSS